MKIAVFGAGGVGGYFGGRLAQAGMDVTFIARGEHLHAMKEKGLFVESISGNFASSPVKVAANCNNVGVVDLILVAVKGWQVEKVAAAMAPMVGEKTLILPLLNGVEAVDKLSLELGEDKVLNGLCGLFAKVVAPGRISHFGAKPFIKLGEQSNQTTDRATLLQQTLDKADGMKVLLVDDIAAAVWEKFVFIASTSGVGSVTRAPFGVIREQPQTRQMLRSLVSEIVDVAKALKIQVSDTLAEDVWAIIESADPSNDTSMQRDIIAGKPSELQSQIGAVIRMGKKTGLKTPYSDMIYASLLPQELKARAEHSDC